jgi:hypothetical protein
MQMRKLHIYLIFFITIPCLVQAQEVGINPSHTDPAYNSPEDDCFPQTHEDYQLWVNYGKPACWCYIRQCHGDADGLSTFGRPVALSDLNILKAGFGKTVTELFGIEYGFCGDFDHEAAFGRPVGLSDLNILKQYFGALEAQVPDCFDIIIPY